MRSAAERRGEGVHGGRHGLFLFQDHAIIHIMAWSVDTSDTIHEDEFEEQGVRVLCSVVSGEVERMILVRDILLQNHDNHSF